MHDGGDDDPQRVARSRFCPDARSGSKQIQVKCCLPAAHSLREGSKPEQPEVKSPSRHKQVTHKNHLPLTAINTTRFNPVSAKVGGGFAGQAISFVPRSRSRARA